MNTPADWKQCATAGQLAGHHCANHQPYNPEGMPPEPHRCLELDSDRLAWLPDRAEAIKRRTCRLFMEKPTRCHYFEDALLPCATAGQLKDYARLVTKGKRDARLTEERLSHRFGRANGDCEFAPSRVCGCGAALGRGRRKCDDCARAARKDAYRRSKARSRGPLSTVSASGAPCQ